MHEAIASRLEAWASFYVIVGSSAAGLTGLSSQRLGKTPDLLGDRFDRRPLRDVLICVL